MVAFALAVALSLGAAPAKSTKTQIKIDVKPAAAIVYVDGQRRGTGAKPIVVDVAPGVHKIRVVHKKDESTDVVRVKQGQILQWGISFEDSSDKGSGRAAKEKEKADANPQAAEEDRGPVASDELSGPDLK
jgi:hypothetical protein